jgi:hypothetical protein
VVQAATGVAALRSDSRQVFSGAVGAAQFIRNHHLEQRPIVADDDHATSAIAIVLDRSFLFPRTGETSDVVVEHNRLLHVDSARIMDAAAELARSAGGSALIVVNYELETRPRLGLVTTLLYRGGAAIMFDESFLIYGVEAKPLESSPPKHRRRG